MRINHHNWKGEKAKYISKHTWIHDNFGKADRCQSKKCINKKCNHFEWANISGQYKRDMSDWKMLCISCHKRMDHEKKFGNKCRAGHEYTKENTYIEPNGINRKCRLCRKLGKY